MKQTLSEFYSPSSDEYKELWEKALIVLDTNVVLNVYRLPATARDEFISVLDLIKKQIWIPYQVALEFQRRRLTVIAAERKITEDVLSSARDMFAELTKKVESLQIDKRGVDAQTGPLLQNLENANNELVKALESAHAAQLDISASDPIRDRLDGILSGKIGDAPKTQTKLDELVLDGVSRFENKIPPGFADADKDKNPSEASFVHNQIRYERKYGDLILWRQLISKVSLEGIKHVILVTADKKEDWWWREHGKTIGPHPELIREIKEKANVDLFWMYSAVQFLEHAKTYAKAIVSTESVEELREVADSPAPAGRVYRFPENPERMSFSDTYLASNRNQHRINQSRAEIAVFEWLSRRHRNLTRAHFGFADFFVENESGLHGFDVMFSSNIMKVSVLNLLREKLLRAYFEVKEGNLSSATIVIAISESDFNIVANSGQIEELRSMIERQTNGYSSANVIVGAIVSESNFEPFLFCGTGQAV